MLYHLVEFSGILDQKIWALEIVSLPLHPIFYIEMMCYYELNQLVMRKIFLILAASVMSFGAYAEGYQVNNMSAKQTGMGHVGTAMQLNSESIFFNPAATAFQKSKFDISAGFTGILSSVRFSKLPLPFNNAQPGDENYGKYIFGEATKSDNGLSTPIHVYFNYKPTDRLALGVGLYTPNGSSMKWGDNWEGAHLVQDIELQAFAFQPTISYKICDKLSIGAGLTINWGNFNLSRSMFRVDAGQQIVKEVLPGLIEQLGPVVGQLPQDVRQDIPALVGNVSKELSRTSPLISAKLEGNSQVAVGVNAGFLWNITDEWSFGMTWRSRLNMKVKGGESSLIYGDNLKAALGHLGGFAHKHQAALMPMLGQLIQQNPQLGMALNELKQNGMPQSLGSFDTELPLPTSVTWGVSFRPTPKWEFAVDLQWVGWSAYDRLVVDIDMATVNNLLKPVVSKMNPIVSVKNYSNTLAFRFGGQYRATDFITARMGMYVDQSPVDSNFLNPETPSMTKVSYTAGLTLRPAKCMDIDLAYCYVSSADPERTGSYPTLNQITGKWETFSGNYTLHANVFSVGMNFHF